MPFLYRARSPSCTLSLRLHHAQCHAGNISLGFVWTQYTISTFMALIYNNNTCYCLTLVISLCLFSQNVSNGLFANNQCPPMIISAKLVELARCDQSGACVTSQYSHRLDQHIGLCVWSRYQLYIDCEQRFGKSNTHGACLELRTRR